ncbi:MAG: threonine/serine dehydratase [Gemmatimonadota bacterium]
MSDSPSPTHDPPLVSLDAVREAADRLAPHIARTPLLTNRSISQMAGRPVYMKGEHLQRTGSFKARGALNALLAGGAREQAGVVTVSAGNHAQAVAWAAAQVGLSATVVMPRSAPAVKVAASRSYGAHVRLVETVQEAFREALRLAELENRFLLHPFDDPHVIAGQGTVGLELHHEMPEEVVELYVPVGGGGLIAGVAAALSALRPALRIFGVEPRGAAAMTAGVKAGTPITLERLSTVADGLAAPMAGRIPLKHVQSQVKGIQLVEDASIFQAMSLLLTRSKAVVEPAGAAGVAALLDLSHNESSAPAATILCGGNVDPSLLARLPF